MPVLTIRTPGDAPTYVLAALGFDVPGLGESVDVIDRDQQARVIEHPSLREAVASGHLIIVGGEGDVPAGHALDFLDTLLAP